MLGSDLKLASFLLFRSSLTVSFEDARRKLTETPLSVVLIFVATATADRHVRVFSGRVYHIFGSEPKTVKVGKSYVKDVVCRFRPQLKRFDVESLALGES